MTFVGILLLVSWALPAWGQEKNREIEWNQILVAAKRDGKVVVIGSPNPVMRRDVLPKFTARYGIQVEFIAGPGATLASRARTERQAGVYSIDIFLAGGIDTAANILYPEKMIDPLKPILILPEVVEPSKWKKEKLWFVDPEERYVLRVFNSVRTLLHINTDIVKPEEIRSSRDLLNPKWRGKISTEDPGIAGSSGAQAAQLYVQLGEEFVKKLYVDQKPAFARDRRQLADRLARGTYPICFGCHADDIRTLQKEGFRLLTIYTLTDVRATVGGAPVFPTIMNRAPHPNAAGVFANWFASKEALEAYSRGYGYATLRTDVEESFLEPGTIPRPAVNYFDDSDWKWAVSGRKDARQQVAKILRSR